MPVTLLMMAGKPKLPERRKFELILVRNLRISEKRPQAGETWATLEETSRATGGNPRVHPMLKSEGWRRIEQAWRKHRAHPVNPELQSARTTMQTSRMMRNSGDLRGDER